MPDSNVRWLVDQRSPLPYSNTVEINSSQLSRRYSFNIKRSN